MQRNATFQKEAFYIAREDGMVIYAEIGSPTSPCISTVGYFDCSLGTAFASLDVPHEPDKGHPSFKQLAAKSLLSNPDVLIGIGPDSDGRLNKVGDWVTNVKSGKTFGTFDFIEAIPNWAPVSDSVISRFPSMHGNLEKQRSSLFVASGREPYGSVSELRQGLNALVHQFVGLEGITAGVTNIWILDYTATETDDRFHIILLIALPLRTYGYKLSGSSLGDFDDIVALDGQDDIQLNDETLCACFIANTVSLQVIREGIILLERSARGLSSIANHRFPAGTTVTAAAAKPEFPGVVATLRQSTRVTLLAVPLKKATSGPKISFGSPFNHNLRGDVTCLEILLIGGFPYVLVGTVDTNRDSFISIFNYDKDDGLDLVLQENITTVCESAAVLTRDPDTAIVCALRNGQLLILALDVPEDEEISIKDRRTIRMGTTPAKVIRSDSDPSTAFVACGSDLCRIQCSAIHPLFLDIHSIFLTDRNMPGYQQPALSALTQLPSMEGKTRNLSGYFFSVFESTLVGAQFDFDIRWSENDTEKRSFQELSKVLPRKFETRSRPTKLFYSHSQDTMVAATMETKQIREPANEHPGIRTVHSSFNVLRLDHKTLEEQIKAEDDEKESRSKLILDALDLKSYEKVYCMVDWSVTDKKGRKWNFIVAGTGVECMVNGQKTMTGRKLFVKCRKTSSGGYQVELKKPFPTERPIYSMALFGENELVYACGDELILEEYIQER